MSPDHESSELLILLGTWGRIQKSPKPWTVPIRLKDWPSTLPILKKRIETIEGKPNCGPVTVNPTKNP